MNFTNSPGFASNQSVIMQYTHKVVFLIIIYIFHLRLFACDPAPGSH